MLLEAGAISADQLARALAERFGLDYVDLTVYSPDLGASNLISAEAARRFSAVPIGFDEDGQLIVAMSDPANVLALDDLKLLTGHEVRPAVATPEDIGGADRAHVAPRRRGGGGDRGRTRTTRSSPAVTDIRESAEDAPVIKLVNSLIAQAVEEGASDIHMEPDGRDMRVRFRVDGVLNETTTIPRRMVAGVVSRVKIMGDLDIAEKRVPQDGRVGLTVEGQPRGRPRGDHAVRAGRGRGDAPARQERRADGPRRARAGGRRPRALRVLVPPAPTAACW